MSLMCGILYLLISPAGVMIGFEQDMHQIEHGESDVFLIIRVIKFGQLRRNITVRFYTEQDTAVGQFTIAHLHASGSVALLFNFSPGSDGEDYNGQDLSLTFTQGDTGRDLNITILGDRVSEPTEYFFGHLETSDADVILNLNSTRVAITDSGCMRNLLARLLAVLVLVAHCMK